MTNWDTYIHLHPLDVVREHGHELKNITPKAWLKKYLDRQHKKIFSSAPRPSPSTNKNLMAELEARLFEAVLEVQHETNQL